MGFLKADDYKQLLISLLPQGRIWEKSQSFLRKLLSAFSVEMERADDSLMEIANSANPKYGEIFLGDWEIVTGISKSGPVQRRTDKVIEQLSAVGGQSKAYIIAAASRLGFLIDIEEFKPFRVGYSVAGDKLSNDAKWRFSFKVITDTAPVTDFYVGVNDVGDSLRYWDNELLRDIIQARKPAHTFELITYAESYARCGNTIGILLRELVKG